MTQDLLFITKPTVTTKEAADLLGVTVQTILKKEKDGLIECVYKNNWKQFGSKIFYLEDIEHLKNKDEVKGLSTKEAAEILNVAPSTIFTYIKSGKLPATMVEKRGKQVYLIDEEELEIFMLDYEKNKTKERKTFITKIQDEDIYLYQLLRHLHTGKIARVIEINGADGKILTEDEEIFPLSTYKEHDFSFEPLQKQAVITKRGYLSFSFKKPQLFNSITYNLINLFYKELGVTNMRLTITSDTIKLEIKPFVLQIEPLQFQEEIKHLHSHMKSGTILPHVEGIYFKSNVEPLTFHADHEFKQKVVQMAADAGIGQEEFLLQAVKSYITNLELD
ncbi:helix-turn-helix domain-containing protein [Bacillus toyonensis]|uniref:helix-turn-helix domain-containing protein n=1 Tax=Bacillus TaxID=1386 RepID=UPI00032FFF52|nr:MULTISPECIES: helix-turn-helix domain-containing protein [Bacillus]EOP29635.1 excisionase family DNA binding domain-containing protein [Bacillus cereus VD131]KAF6547516.1 helix-turn-helix domain-containing protein [Bacillus sp. EKM202B]MBJ8043339.1 helix-turn-helix domain-containing protein [Bacillus cereus group sp. N17]MCS3600638.1 excisionase family DNA binding protein [Bacillus sp. JUb91]MCU5305580.1 helix-turn-helix domain-containing protein [Bacillus toyonensis]